MKYLQINKEPIFSFSPLYGKSKNEFFQGTAVIFLHRETTRFFQMRCILLLIAYIILQGCRCKENNNLKDVKV